MTLKEFFDMLATHPTLILAYFVFIPLIAALANFMGKGEGHLSPWKYLYSTLIYLVCVPGIFAITLNIYLFLFQKQNIFETDIYTQILPILSMVFTLIIIKSGMDLDLIPGFGKLSGMFMMIFAVLCVMWVVDRTRFFVGVFSYMPFHFVILIFAALILFVRTGFKRML